MEVSFSQDFDTNQWRSEVWMWENQEFQLLEKKKPWKSILSYFGDRPPKFRTPSAETWQRAMGFSHWRRFSETVLRTFAQRQLKHDRELLISVTEGNISEAVLWSFAPRRAKLSEVTHFMFFTFFAIFSPFFRLVPRVYPSWGLYKGFFSPYCTAFDPFLVTWAKSHKISFFLSLFVFFSIFSLAKHTLEMTIQRMIG